MRSFSPSSNLSHDRVVLAVGGVCVCVQQAYILKILN